MTSRKERKALARWEEGTRDWAHETARDLVMAMVRGEPMPATPYRIGVILEPEERVWAECPVRFLQERAHAAGPGASWPPIRPWLITSVRVVGRLADDRLYGWRWEQMRGCRVDLSIPSELVALDCAGGERLDWTGPGVAPLAVATIYRLHGPRALAEHPGLDVLRVDGRRLEAPARDRRLHSLAGV